MESILLAPLFEAWPPPYLLKVLRRVLISSQSEGKGPLIFPRLLACSKSCECLFCILIGPFDNVHLFRMAKVLFLWFGFLPTQLNVYVCSSIHHLCCSVGGSAIKLYEKNLDCNQTYRQSFGHVLYTLSSTRRHVINMKHSVWNKSFRKNLVLSL